MSSWIPPCWRISKSKRSARNRERGNLSGTGKVQFNEDRTVRILAPLPGQVVDFHLRVGDPIEKDQLLFSIKSREVASLVTDYLESQRDLDLAQKTYNMNKDLFEHQAASRISFQQAESDLAKANTNVARGEEALRVLGIDPKEAVKDGGLRSLVPVRSPMAGTLIERNLTPGQFVQADSTALLTIADLSTVWVLVDVFERDIHLVQVGSKSTGGGGGLSRPPISRQRGTHQRQSRSGQPDAESPPAGFESQCFCSSRKCSLPPRSN